jgi:small subunit ribosomal protein S6
MRPCLYELFALAKPGLAKTHLADIMKSASRVVLDHGGIITDIKSFGDQPLAYDIRKPGTKFGEVRSAWV